MMPLPRRPLTRGVAMAVLGAALLGCDGTPLPEPAAVWTTPVEIPGGDVNSGPRQLVAAGSELFLLTHLSSHPRNDDFTTKAGDRLALHAHSGGSWSAPQVIATLDAGRYVNGRIARDGLGRLHAIWALAHHTAGDPFLWDFSVQYRSRTGATWSAAETLHETVQGQGPPPRAVGAVTAADGRVHLMFEETHAAYDATLGTVARFMEQAGGAWSTRDVRVGAGAFFGANLAAVGAADVSAVFVDHDTPKRIWMLHFRNGTWGTPLPAHTVTQDATLPQLAVESTGRMHLVWQERGLFHSVSENGTTWSAPTRLTAEGAFAHGPPLLLMDRDDRLHLIHAGTAVGYMRYRNGTWSTVNALPVGHNFESPRAAIDGDSRLHLVWSATGGRMLHSSLDVSR